MTELGKREEVVQLAIEIFGDRGYRATSMRDLANHVGLSKSALYHYFASKEELLTEIYKIAIAENIAAAQAVAAHGVEPAAALRQMLVDRIIFTCGNRQILQIFHEEETELSEHLQREVLESRRAYQQLMIKLLERGRSSGDFQFAGSPTIVANGLLGACIWSYKWYRPEGTMGPEALAAQLADVLLGGVLAVATSDARA